MPRKRYAARVGVGGRREATGRVSTFGNVAGASLSRDADRSGRSPAWIVARWPFVPFGWMAPSDPPAPRRSLRR
jgi:hypothetical protein